MVVGSLSSNGKLDSIKINGWNRNGAQKNDNRRDRAGKKMLAKSHLVPRRGLEPPRVAPLVPETSASTNSATSAKVCNAR